MGKVAAFRQGVSGVMDPAVLISVRENEMSCCDKHKMSQMKVGIEVCLRTVYGGTADYFLIIWKCS